MDMQHIRDHHRAEKCTCGEIVRLTMMAQHLQTSSLRHTRCPVCDQALKDSEMLQVSASLGYPIG